VFLKVVDGFGLYFRGGSVFTLREKSLIKENIKIWRYCVSTLEM